MSGTPTFAQHWRHVVSEPTNRLCCLTPDTRPAVIASDRRPQHRPNLGWNATATQPGNAAAWDATPSLSGATLAPISAPWYPRPGRLAVRIRCGESIGEPCPTNEASLCLRPQRSRRRPSRSRLADPLLAGHAARVSPAGSNPIDQRNLARSRPCGGGPKQGRSGRGRRPARPAVSYRSRRSRVARAPRWCSEPSAAV